MKKYFKLCLVLLIITFFIQPVYAKENLQLHSEYAYLYDPQTSLVYIDQKSQEKIYPASMTKILTVSLAIEKIENIHEKVRVAYDDLKGLIAQGASTAGFYEGELVTYEDLLYGALLPSGADACQTLGRLLFGSTDQMVEAMNQKVQELNLKNTHFANVTGLHDDNHYTTSQEMALILSDALAHESFVKIFESRTYTSSNQRLTWISSLQRAVELKNIDTSVLDGGKSGYTDEAQLTFASTMTIDGHQLILVTAKADGQRTQNHANDAVSVYRYMNANYKNYIIYKKDEDIHSYWVLHSWDFYRTYQALEDMSILVEKSIVTDDIQKQFTGDSFFIAPFNAGGQIGIVKVIYQNNVLYQYPLVMQEALSYDISAVVLIYGFAIMIPVLGVIVKYKKKKS